jgi:uncharacterized phage-associated protein
MQNLRAIANYFIGRALKDGVEMSPMKLQKLVFFAYGLYLAMKGKELFSERFEAWPWGPVISSLYHQLKSYGSRSIDQPVYDTDPVTGEKTMPVIDAGETELLQFLGTFWDKYKGYTAFQLSNATHLPGTPWAKTIEEKGGGVIDDPLIKEYFQHQY